MGKAPQKTRAAFEALRKEYPFRVVLKGIKGKFYVYKENGVWVKELGKTKTISEYLGKITEEGLFVKKALSAKDDLENAKALISEHGGEIIWHEKKEGEEKQLEFRETTTKEVDLKLLTALSMNSRASVSMLAKLSGLNQQVAYHKVKMMEDMFGIRYLPEIDVEKFGYLQFLVTVKFLKEIPTADELKKAIENEPRIQFVVITKGSFDLVMHMLAKNNAEADNTLIILRRNLSGYDSIWSAIPIYETYGFIPIRCEFIDLLNTEGKLLLREKAVLNELNKDGKIDFTEIDKRYGFDPGRAQYSFHKLKADGKIRRMTISMEKMPLRYIGLIFIEIINRSVFDENRTKLLSDITSEAGTLTNEYLAVYDMINPEGGMLCVPVMNYNDLDSCIERISNLQLGVRLSTLVFTNVLIGNLCYRKFDNAYSSQQKILEEQYRMHRAIKTDYEETGRKKEKEIYYRDIRGSKLGRERLDN